jgi:hypothetical protein
MTILLPVLFGGGFIGLIIYFIYEYYKKKQI